jgi:hypothetical protein
MSPILRKQRTRIGKALYEISRVRHSFIPITEIDKVLRDNGLKLIQEDGTDWSGMLCGNQSQCLIDVADLDGVQTKSVLALQWYKSESHIKSYEINCYLS